MTISRSFMLLFVHRFAFATDKKKSGYRFIFKQFARFALNFVLDSLVFLSELSNNLPYCYLQALLRSSCLYRY